MLVDRVQELPPGPPGSRDVLIIGAGTAGLFLAQLLADRGYRVTILEGGGRTATTEFNRDQVELVGRTHRASVEGRALGLGGTSTLWGGQLAPFDREDFTRDYAPWPISAEQVISRYDEVYAHLGVSDGLNDDDYRSRLGGAAVPGEPIERFFTRWLPVPNFARLYGPRLRAADGPQVVLNTRVDAFRFVDQRLVAVQGESGGERFELAVNRVVISTGTLGSLRLLLGSGARGGMPWSDHPWLGDALQDHISMPLGSVTPTDPRLFRELFENARVGAVRLQPKLRWSVAGRAEQGANAPGVSGIFLFASDLAEHLANLKILARGLGAAASGETLRRVPASLMAVGRNFAPFVWRYVRDRRVMAFWDRGLTLQAQAEQLPIRRSRVRLTDGRAADGLPRLEIDWRIDGSELAGIATFARAARDRLAAHGLARVDLLPAVETGSNEMLAAEQGGTNHPCGGARMGSSPSSSIVDPDLRVHGVANLHLLSASAFPTSSHANCTLTLLALALRLADHIVSQGDRS